MNFKDLPIQRKLLTANLLTSGVVLILTCVSFFAYELHRFRSSTLRHISVLSEITATNSTAALAFDSPEEALVILHALKAEKHLVGAALYDKNGKLFSHFPLESPPDTNLVIVDEEFYRFHKAHLEAFYPVVQGDHQLGTLYLKSDLKAMDERFRLYGIIVLLVIAVSSLIAYLLSIIFQRNISRPILELTETARAISSRNDYSVKATKAGNDEVGWLTDAFNFMISQIQEKNRELENFNKTLEKKVAERTIELENAIKIQQKAEAEIQSRNEELSSALEELRKTENRLIELNNELEQRVNNRTKELLASQGLLKTKNDELKKMNVDLDNFIYTASHDLRSPIVNLEGLTHLMRNNMDGEGNFNNPDLLEMVDTSVQKLKKIINDLAEITKVQKDLEEDVSVLSIEDVVNGVMDDLKENINSSKATINIDLQIDEIAYPKNNLRSIVYNLLSNAIKYQSPERTPEIKLSTYRESGYIVLCVSDNGLGINEQQLPKMFTMFKRFHAHVEGTGIGLYIIKRIVENRGGKIELESTQGKGSTFKVFLKKEGKI